MKFSDLKVGDRFVRENTHHVCEKTQVNEYCNKVTGKYHTLDFTEEPISPVDSGEKILQGNSSHIRGKFSEVMIGETFWANGTKYGKAAIIQLKKTDLGQAITPDELVWFFDKDAPVMYTKLAEEKKAGQEWVDHPQHYNQGQIETMTIMKDWGIWEAFSRGSALKYLHRYKHKGSPILDLEKARFYIDELIKIEQEGVGENQQQPIFTEDEIAAARTKMNEEFRKKEQPSESPPVQSK